MSAFARLMFAVGTATLGLSLAAPARAQDRPAAAGEAVSRTGLWVRLDAREGKEEEVARFLKDGKAIVEGEPATATWFAIRLDRTRFAIFDTFPDECGRDAHLSGQVAAALMQQAPTLLQHPPSIEKVDVLAVKGGR